MSSHSTHYPYQTFPALLQRAGMSFQGTINTMKEELSEFDKKARIPSEAGLMARGRAEAYREIIRKLECDRDLMNHVYILSQILECVTIQQGFEQAGVNVDSMLKDFFKSARDPIGEKFGSPQFLATIKRMEEAA
ncbi:hypothetical protein ACFOEK_12160 [Litoribrevibacter euphylliae]|uniref:Uncharacterized protein n=1 Tax=Litoribrevibacter euphylliae TaxID=1834034 RepID=A0ABV7HD26_9GAMM